jgi:exopolysaccharide biosynthesis polyprenyl glycosylphosphotransferase
MQGRDPEAGMPNGVPRASTAARTHRASLLRRFLALADALAIVIALACSVLVGGADAANTQFALGVLTLPVWIVLFKLYGLYDQDGKRLSHSTVDDMPWVFHVVVVGSLVLWFFLKAATEHKLILSEGATFFLVAFMVTLSLRSVVRRLARLAEPPTRLLVVGGGPVARMLVRKVRTHPEYHLQPIGYLDQLPGHPEGLNGDLPYLGEISELRDVCVQNRVAHIAVASPAVDETTLTELIRWSKDFAVRVSIVPSAVDVLGPSVEIDDIEGLTVLALNPPVLPRSSRSLKRAMDLALAAPLLVIMIPLMLAAAAVVKLGSSGPVFYSQERVGRHGRRFRLYKFRTMVVDAEARAEELRPLSAHPAWLDLDHDPRITRIGRVLRHTSIDELPQLWNILRGDMSLVGPRPMSPDVQERIEGWGARRLDLTPGLTGPWQVLGRTNIPFEEMVRLDYLYVTNWSLWWDVRLMVRTLPAVLQARGVN